MVTHALIAMGLGAAFALLGWLGLTGRLLRSPSSDTVRNFWAQILLGSFLVCGGLIVLFQPYKAVAALLALPTLVLLITGVWASFVGPPQWVRRRFGLVGGRTKGGKNR